MKYLVAYDIADPARLRRVARFMERYGLRCQKSVFMLRGDAQAGERLLDAVVPLLNLQEDVVQAWRLSAEQPSTGMARGCRLNIYPGAVLFADSLSQLIGERDEVDY